MEIKTFDTVFKHIIEEILCNLQPKCAVTYIDNITVFSPLMEQHIVDVEAGLEQLNNVNLKFYIEKFIFIMN